MSTNKLEELSKRVEYFQKETEETKKEWLQLNNGEKTVIWSYITQMDQIQDSKYYKYTTNDLVLQETLWAKDMGEIVVFLRKLGIEEFIYANNSTEALKSIANLLDIGCKIVKSVVYKTDRWGNEYTGVLVDIKK